MYLFLTSTLFQLCIGRCKIWPSDLPAFQGWIVYFIALIGHLLDLSWSLFGYLAILLSFGYRLF